LKLRLFAILLVCVWPLAASIVYTDNFDSGAQLPWGNQRGDWTVADGVYHAGSPNSHPVTASLLPYDVTDFIAEVDITGLGDGGLWARTDSAATFGVMLILHSDNIYWHVITDPVNGPWDFYNVVGRSGSNVHVTLTGVGNILSAYLDNAPTPITTLDLSTISRPGYDYSSGRFGLYSNSSVTFDNVSLTDVNGSGVPEPVCSLLIAGGLAALCALGRRRR
jgi:hypothetical protein